MSTQLVSNYSFLLLNLAAYLTLLTVAYPALLEMPDGYIRRAAAALFVGFGLLLALYPRTEHRPRLVHLYLAAQTTIILGVFLLNPGSSLNVQILFFVLSAQAMLFLPTRTGIVWITLFFIITMVGGSMILGWDAVGHMFSMAGGYAFFGTFGSALRQADEARRQSQQLLEALQTAHQQLQTYASQAERLAAAEERNRLAREMHDALGHRLTVAVVQLEGAQRLIPSDPDRAARMVTTMREQLKEALGELRQAVTAWRAPNPDDASLPLEPFDKAVTQLARAFQDATGLTVHLELAPGLPTLPMPYRLALYRVIQESLTNIQRHAAATRAWLEITLTETGVTLAVSDDGKSFPEVVKDGTFGLRGLRERAEQLGGKLSLGSRPGGGAQVCFHLPLPMLESGHA